MAAPLAWPPKWNSRGQMFVCIYRNLRPRDRVGAEVVILLRTDPPDGDTLFIRRVSRREVEVDSGCSGIVVLATGIEPSTMPAHKMKAFNAIAVAFSSSLASICR